MRACAFVVAALAAACGSSGVVVGDVDGGGPDAVMADASEPELFVVTGDCGVLDSELTSTTPSAFSNRALFDREYTDLDEPALSDGGREIIADGNAGGSSIHSEVFAHEFLESCEGALLLKTETEIVYDGPSKRTDFLAAIDGVSIGVSVTRAQTFPLDEPLSDVAALALLDGKLADILESTANVSAADRWSKQILAVVVYNDQHLAALETALAAIDALTRADTIVWMTVTDGPDQFIYE